MTTINKFELRIDGKLIEGLVDLKFPKVGHQHEVALAFNRFSESVKPIHHAMLLGVSGFRHLKAPVCVPTVPVCSGSFDLELKAFGPIKLKAFFDQISRLCEDDGPTQLEVLERKSYRSRSYFDRLTQSNLSKKNFH